VSADLKVVDVVLPPGPLRAPCPVVVVVKVRNDGNDSAVPVPYDVTIQTGVSDAPSATFEVLVTDPEDQALSPGREIDVPVRVQFRVFRRSSCAPLSTRDIGFRTTIAPRPP
jgi:hypothetical protein